MATTTSPIGIGQGAKSIISCIQAYRTAIQKANFEASKLQIQAAAKGTNIEKQFQASIAQMNVDRDLVLSELNQLEKTVTSMIARYATTDSSLANNMKSNTTHSFTQKS